MKNSNDHSSIKSVKRAVNVLTALSNNLNRVSDIATETNLSTSTVHRLLQALKESGLVIQDTLNHKYYFGHLMAKFSSDPFVTHQHLMRIARKNMEYLRDISRETIAIYIRFGLERIRLMELVGPQNITYIGQREVIDPVWPGSHGKVLLSQIPQDKLEEILKKLELKKITSRTITDKIILNKEVEIVRQQGYAVSYGESTEGIAGISVPIRNYIDAVSLSIIGPEERFASKMMNFLAELKKTANEISQELLKADFIGSDSMQSEKKSISSKSKRIKETN